MVACASIVGFGGCHTKLLRFCIHAGSGLRFFTSFLLRLQYASLNSLSRVRTYGPNRASAVAHTDSTDSVFTSVELVEDADGGGRRLLELIKRRLSSEHELSAVRLVASIDVALMVDGDDVRAENERLRAAAEDAHADAEDARGSVLCGNLHRVDGV